MKKIFLIVAILTQLSFTQSNLLLLFDETTSVDTGAILLDSLQAYWALENVNDSHGGNTLTNSGTVAFATGKVNNAAVFTATSNNYLTINDNAALSMGDIDFTLSCWAYATAFTNATNGVIGKLGGAGAREYNIGWSNAYTPDAFFGNISNDGTAQATAVATAEGLVNTWYFLMMWYDKTKDSVYFQINNSTIYQAAASGGAYDGTIAFMIGRAANSTVVDWTGLIDEASVWKRVLTPAERTYLYNDGTGRTYTGGKIQ